MLSLSKNYLKKSFYLTGEKNNRSITEIKDFYKWFEETEEAKSKTDDKKETFFNNGHLYFYQDLNSTAPSV